MQLISETAPINESEPVMWSGTVGLMSDKTGLRPKNSVLVLHTADVLVLHVWCSFVKHDLVTLVIIMIRNDIDTATFQVLFSFSILCLEHHYCGDQQWRSLT